MKNLSLISIIVILMAADAFSQEKGRFSGVAYADYLYNIARDSSFGSFSNTALSGPNAFQAFQFRRIYFTYDYDMTAELTSRFRLEADQGALTSDGKIGVFVKDAFVRWKEVFGKGDLIVGIQPTPAFDVSEGFWGYRSLEKTLLDLRGIVSSRDFGLALKGKLDDGGMASYWLMFANGSGNRPEGDKYKRYYGHVQMKPSSLFTITAYADYSAKSPIVDPYSPSSARVSNATLTTALFAGFLPSDQLRIGGEGYLQSTSHGFNTGTMLETRTGIGWALFAVWSASPAVDLIGRYDFVDTNTKSGVNGDARGYALAALAYKIDKSFLLMPNIQVETYEKASAGPSLDASVTGRVTFVWMFP